MQIARSATAGADGKLASQMCLRTRRKGRDFLMPDMNPLDLSLTTQRICQAIQAVTDDAIDPFHNCRCEHFSKLIRNCSYHGTSLRLNRTA